MINYDVVGRHYNYDYERGNVRCFVFIQILQKIILTTQLIMQNIKQKK